MNWDSQNTQCLLASRLRIHCSRCPEYPSPKSLLSNFYLLLTTQLRPCPSRRLSHSHESLLPCIPEGLYPVRSTYVSASPTPPGRGQAGASWLPVPPAVPSLCQLSTVVPSGQSTARAPSGSSPYRGQVTWQVPQTRAQPTCPIGTPLLLSLRTGSRSNGCMSPSGAMWGCLEAGQAGSWLVGCLIFAYGPTPGLLLPTWREAQLKGIHFLFFKPPKFGGLLSMQSCPH